MPTVVKPKRFGPPLAPLQGFVTWHPGQTIPAG